MTGNTTSRHLRRSDVPGVLDLFARTFGRQLSPEHYRWKLLSRPSPVENVAIAVDERDAPVFHFAGIPCRCMIRGVERWVMVVVDVMTDPAFQRRGLLTTQSAAVFEQWRAAGIALVLGLPNQNWGSRTEALGWKPLGPLASLVLPLRPERLVARRLGLPWLATLSAVGSLWRMVAVPQRAADSGIEVEAVTEVDQRFDALWSQAATRITSSLVRDRSWVAWRYIAAPEQGYRLLLASRNNAPRGYAAWRLRGDRTAMLAEIFATPGDSRTFASLVRAVVQSATSSGCDFISTLAGTGSWPHRQLRRTGFFRTRHAFGVRYVPLDPSLTPDALDAPRDWYLVGSDFDTV